MQVVYGNQNWSTPVRGVGPEYLALKNWDVVHGGMYTEVDVERANAVCVLGQTVVDQLFGALDPIGETIRVTTNPASWRVSSPSRDSRRPGRIRTISS